MKPFATSRGSAFICERCKVKVTSTGWRADCPLCRAVIIDRKRAPDIMAPRVAPTPTPKRPFLSGPEWQEPAGQMMIAAINFAAELDAAYEEGLTR